MAVYSGQFHYEDIIPGSRVQGVKQAQNIPVKANTSDFRSTTNLVKGHVVDSLFGFDMRRPIISISVEPTIGAVVATHIRDPRNYQLIRGEEYGVRHQRVKDEDALTLDAAIGQRVNKVLTGVGAFGIGYNPQPTPQQPDGRSIRKYPRDWHGEHMR